MSSGEPESASLQRSENIFCRRAGAAFGVGALQGGKIGVIFLIPWQRRVLRNPGQLSISAGECCSSFQHPLQEAVNPCLVRGWKAGTSSGLVENLPKVMSLFLSKPFLPFLSLCVCFAAVWKQRMDSGGPAWALSLHLPSPAVALVLCAFVTSLGQQTCDNALEMLVFICSFLALEVS